MPFCVVWRNLATIDRHNTNKAKHASPSSKNVGMSLTTPTSGEETHNTCKFISIYFNMMVLLFIVGES
jgi:hypothetical protein